MKLSITPMYLTPQKSLVPSETMSHSTEPVIPDESACADEIRNPAKVQYHLVLSGSRLASRLAGLGRDDGFQTVS